VPEQHIALARVALERQAALVQQTARAQQTVLAQQTAPERMVVPELEPVLKPVQQHKKLHKIVREQPGQEQETGSKLEPVQQRKTAWQRELAPQQQMASKLEPVLDCKTAQELKLAPARQIVREQETVQGPGPPEQEQEFVPGRTQEQKKAQE
jgi:hypothetical protein